MTARLRAAWNAFRTGRTYDDGYHHGIDDAFDGIQADLPNLIDTHLGRTAAPKTGRHLTLVGGAAR